MISMCEGLQVARVEVVKENMYLPFTLPPLGPDGRYQRQEKADMHFGMIDSGAMVSCCIEVTMRSFPALQTLFQAEESAIKGVGEVVCHVLGSCVCMPVSMGCR